MNAIIEGRNVSIDLDNTERMNLLNQQSNISKFLEFDESTANPFKENAQ